MAPLRFLLTVPTLLIALAVSATPAAGQEGEGSVGGAIVGGLAGGAVGLLSFYPLSGCPMITVGAAREADWCDAGGVATGVVGLGAGIWAGSDDAGAGYGMALGALAGVGAAWVLGQVAHLFPPQVEFDLMFPEWVL